MALETGTYVSDLVVTNPPGADQIRQGDDHIRLVKTVLKNTFPNATRPFNFPNSLTKTADYSVIGTDQNALIIVNNAAAMNLTMPSLGAGDAGWSIRVLKLVSSVGPLFILPPSGSIISGQVSVAKARRNIPGVPFEVLWTGSNWVVERCVREPVGSVLPFFMTTLPTGFEWPNGQTLVSGDFPEYENLRGGATTPDLRQRSLFGSNLGGGDPARITSVLAATLETAGGHQSLQSHSHGSLTGEENTSHSHGGTTASATDSGYSLDHTHTEDGSGSTFATWGTGGSTGTLTTGATSETGFNSTSGYNLGAHAHAITARVNLGFQDANHKHGIASDGVGNAQNIPPCMVCNYVLVVE